MTEILAHPFWDWLTRGSVTVGFFACVIFLTRYLSQAGRDAWRNPFGRYLIQRKSVLAVLFVVVLANQMFGQWPARRAAVALIMTAFALQTFMPYRLLRDAQRAHETEEAPSMSGDYASEKAAGAGELPRDGKIGNIVNGVVTVAALGVVEWLGSIDFSTLPTFVATVGAPVAGLIAGLITTKVLPRYKVRRASR